MAGYATRSLHAVPETFSDLSALYEHMADAVYLIDPQTSHILWSNRRGWEMLGLSRAALLHHSVLSLQKDVHGMPQWQDIAAAISASGAAGYRFEGRHCHASGHEVVVDVITTHFQHQGRAYFLSVARDITRRAAQSQAHEEQLWFALNESNDGLWDWDVLSGTLFFSPQLKRMLGYGPEEMQPILSVWSDNVHPQDRARVMQALSEHMAGKNQRYEAEYRLRNRNGDYLWVHDRGRVSVWGSDGAAQHVIGMVRNISAHKTLEAQLQRLATHDQLTDLPNRREGMRFIAQQEQQCQRLGQALSLIFIDVDSFKAINDRYGHQRGDEVLHSVAQTLLGAVRASDLLCRWGGEEFVLIAPGCDASAAQTLAQQLCLGVQLHFADSFPAVTVSVGVATAAQVAQFCSQALLAQADAALYRAKTGGRNRVVVG